MPAMDKHITTSRRMELAALVGISDAYLYQCLTGRRDMGPTEARRCEAMTNGELHRWNLCQRTWAGIWPELIGADGAPPVPAEVAA